ncbi:MAG: serine/threonine-protein kinase PknK [Planctomycetota bacterium]
MGTGSFAAGEFISNRYRVLEKLGAGAMGTVYLVEDIVRTHRKVALKILKSETLDDTEVWSKGEYEALTRLRHPNLARVHDFGRIADSDDYYIVSEYIRGHDLFSATRDLGEEPLHDVIVQVCRALEYIHTQGYVHFDIKPENILVTFDRSIGTEESSKVMWSPDAPPPSDPGSGPPRVKLIDFGLAEQLSGTFDFAIKGTLNYVAPEIIQGRNPDKRADLYSLGVTLFQIMTGKVPFIGDEGAAVARERVNWREEIREALSGQPAYVADILVRLLEDRPERRFNSAREIIQALNAGAGRHFQIETAETQVSYLYCSRLVGRRTELNRLRDEAEAIFQEPRPRVAADGSRGGTSVVTKLLREGSRRRAPMILISGEIGIGKSRLFEEFSHFLKMREVPVHVGNSYETASDPYQPFRELIEQLALSIGLDSEAFLKHAPAVTRLCPKLRSGDAASGSGAGYRPDKERLFFIDSLASFIVEAAAVRPCVVNLNNLHWMDDASTELLARLTQAIETADAARTTPLPLLLLGTLRSDESLPESLRTLLKEMREESRVREVALRRFNRAQIAELMHHMLAVEEIPRGFLDRLEERTSGNPLFIVEILKVLQEEGIIARDGDSWKIRPGTDLQRVEMPQGIEAILLRRVKVLDPERRGILQWMAVYDKPMSIKLIGRIPGPASIGPRRALTELENRGMTIKVIDGGKPLYTIAQPKLREIVYEDIPEDRRRELHGHLADALRAEYEGHEEVILEDLASHYQSSDRAGKALEYTIRAGDALRKIFAHKRAIDHYRHALRQIEGDPEHLATWCETHEKIADGATIAGDYEVAQASYELLLDLEEGDLGHRDRARLLRKKGKLDEIQGDYARALRGYKEAAELLQDAESVEDRSESVRVHSSLAWVHVCLGQYEKAMSISSEALRLAEELDQQSEHAMIFSTIGSASFFRGHFEEAVEFHTRALEIRERMENAPEIIISLNNLGEAYMASGEYMEALRHFEQACSAAEEIGDAFGRAMALHRLAEVHLRLGANDEAARFLDDSLKLSRDYRMRFLNTRNYLLRGRLNRHLDKLSKAEADLFRALGVFARQGSRLNVAECLLEVAEIHALRGDCDQALQLIQEAVGNAVGLNVTILEAKARLLACRVEREAGRAPAEELLDRLQMIADLLDGTKSTELLAAVQLELAEIHVQGRNLEEARSSYRAAENTLREVVDRLPHKYRDSYLALHHITGTPSGESRVAVREVGLDREEPMRASDRGDRTIVVRKPSETPSPARPDQERELLRITTLLQELGQGANVCAMLPKVLNCLIQGSGAETGMLLLRRGDEVRLLGAYNRRGEPLRQAGDRICLEALELAWDTGDAILAPRVVDDPRVGEFEALYENDVASLAVLPVRLDSSHRAAVYLVNADTEQLAQPAGGPLLVSYQNLLALMLPRVVAERPTTVR